MGVPAEIADYYERAMAYLLADIAGRPLYFLRPDPAGPGAYTYERHPLPDLKHVATVKIVNSKGELADFAVINDAGGVRELLDHGAIEFHPWNATAHDVEHADRLVFDVDPGVGVTLEQVKQATQAVRDYLQEAGLQSFLRTSGRKGFHVVVPLRPARSWAEVRTFTRKVAEDLERRHPNLYVSKSALSLRPGKIFIDYLRNGRGTTAAATYSLRAAPRWPAALPLAWTELEALPAPDAFTAKQACRRLAVGYVNPWIAFNEVQQTLP